MRPFLVKGVGARGLRGKIYLLGDKSIAHRCIILAALSKGKTIIENFPINEDCLASLNAFRKLGIKISLDLKRGEVLVFGKGLYGLNKPRGDIFVGDSGTTFRLLLGVLAGCGFRVKLTAGKSLVKRPMLRVTGPLRQMGAFIKSKIKNQKSKIEEYPPVIIQGGNLKAITYKMPVHSAQVKSAILLAGLYAKGETAVIEPIKTRDHTERALRLFKAGLKLKKNKIAINGKRELSSPGRIYIPGDISSASFFIVAAAILPDSKILIKNVNLNPSRIGIIKVLKRMGADIKIKNQKSKIKNCEPSGDLLVKYSRLRGTVIKKEEVPSLIDELPILMLAACYAKGKTIFKGIAELRFKETDRIKSMLANLKKMGAEIKVAKAGASEGMVIRGIKQLKGQAVRSFGDHRTAMSMAVAGVAAEGETLIDDISCINKSFPNFFNLLTTLSRR